MTKDQSCAYSEVRQVLRGHGLSYELLGNLAAGSDEAHNVWVEGQLSLQVYFLLEQLQGPAAQPCISHTGVTISSRMDTS